MFKIRNYTITFLLIPIFLSFNKNSRFIYAACYTDCCLEWSSCCHDDCSNPSGDCQGCDSCCARSGQCEAECPCDDACNGSCTLPSCPSGYDRTNPNNLCSSDTKKISCSYSNGCGNPCGVNASCYRLETNIAKEEEPERIIMSVDGERYTLSTNASTPKRIKTPSAITESNQVLLTIAPSINSNIAINRGIGYIFRVNNYGVNNEWIAWTDCKNPRPEDFCKESGENNPTVTFVPTVLTPSMLSIKEVLKEGAKGNVGGLYYSINRCDDNRLYSPVLQAYYQVNNSSKICDPAIEDCPCDETKEVCTIINTQPESSVTERGCKTTTHSGKEANNPLKLRLQAKDKDGNDEIKSYIIWFSKSGITPLFTKMGSSYTSTDSNELGIMIMKNGTSWSNTPKVYGIGIEGVWGLLTNNTVKDDRGSKLISVHNITVSESDGYVVAKLDIVFTDKVNGMFELKALALDNYMYLSDGRVDQSYLKKYAEWGVDLVTPVIEKFTQKILSPKNFNLEWKATDSISTISALVVNAYRTDTGYNGVTSKISMSGKNDIILNTRGESVPGEDKIGLLTDSNTWKYTNVNQNPYIGTGLVNINNNELGTITLHGTVYDKACNYTTTNSLQVRLDPWYGTKGGVLYSEGSLGIPAKEILNISNIRNFVTTEIDKSTELLISSGQYIANLFKPSLGAVRATNIYDTNLRVNFWYNYLFEKFEEQKEYLKQINNISQCNTGENCYIYSTKNISIPSGTVCKGRVIVISDKDIHIEPNIESIGGNSGCIFLSGNNITLGSGRYLSSSNIVEYDYIDALMLAENRIEIEYTDGEKSLRDGLEINGSLLSLGSKLNMDSGIYQRRDLRLYNAIYPSLLVNYSYKYTNLSDIFFGRDSLLHKREVGSKGL